jgi:hypothetical protein
MANDQDAKDYERLRQVIGVVGLLLPWILIIGKIILDGPGYQGSISAYYYTHMRDYFVGSMCATGLALISYGYTLPLPSGGASRNRIIGLLLRDDVLSTAAGIFAIGVAFFPTTRDGAESTNAENVVGKVHLSCAVLLFCCLGIFSLFIFTKTDPLGATPRKLIRNKVYRVCGWLIFGSVGGAIALGIYSTVRGSDGQRNIFDGLHALFWLESIAVVSFSVSGIVKGQLFGILRDTTTAAVEVPATV